MAIAKTKYALFIALTIQPCFADNWGINDKKELPAEKSENRIIKWCDNKTGKNTRYASANIEIKDHHPCGAIVSNETCDGENNKILSKPKSGIFKKCNKADSGLSRGELNELKVAMKQAADKQNSDPEIQLQVLADKLLASLMGGDNKKISKLLSSKDPQKLMRDLFSTLEKSLPLLDPNTRKLVEPLLKNLKKGKY